MILKKVTNLRLHSQEEGGKRLYIDDDNELYISTTSLLSLYEDQTGLQKWVESLGKEEADRQRDEAAQRGTLAHSEVEHFLEHKTFPDNISVFGKVAIEGFYNSTEIYEMEGLVAYNDGNVRFAGRFDQLLTIPANTFRTKDSIEYLEKKLVICDLKTKKKAPNLQFAYMFKHLLQSSAYVIAKELIDDIVIDGIVIIFASPKMCKQVYLPREYIDYYWGVYHSFLEDYYGITKLTKTWNELVAAAEYCWNDTTYSFTAKTPVQIIKVP
jgi:hypothetical protein